MAETPSIFVPRSIADVAERLARFQATVCDCDVSTHLDTLHDLVADDIPWLLDLVNELYRQSHG